jgi:hypothetical protein
MKIKQLAILLTMAALLSSLSYRIALGWQVAPSKPHRAFSWIETEYKLTGATSAVPIRTQRHAVRADGSRADAMLDRDGNVLSRLVILPNERKMVSIYEDLKVITTVYLEQQRADNYKGYTGNDTCSNISIKSLAGEEQVMGYRTFKYTSTGSLDGETATFTSWNAPDLDCIALRGSLELTANGKTTKSAKEISNLQLGDPDAWLFMIPSDYQEMSPSAVERLRGEKLGRPVPPLVLEHAAKSDERYYQSQQNRP